MVLEKSQHDDLYQKAKYIMPSFDESKAYATQEEKFVSYCIAFKFPVNQI